MVLMLPHDARARARVCVGHVTTPKIAHQVSSRHLSGIRFQNEVRKTCTILGVSANAVSLLWGS